MIKRKEILVAFLFLLTSVSANATDTIRTYNELIKTWYKTEINTERINIKPDKNIINELEVIDARADKARFGIFTNNLNHTYQVVFDKAFHEVIENTLIAKSGGHSVLLVLKNYWISEITFISQKTKSDSTKGKPGVTKLFCSIDASIKQGEEYLPLTKIDTTFTATKTILFSPETLTKSSLLFIQHKLWEAVNLKKYEGRKHYNKEFITKEYNKKYELPILKDTVFKKGIYYTWDQFKNNHPTEKKFTIVNNKREPSTLFVKDEKGNDVLTRDVYAISDGKNLYKIYEGFVSPIYKSGTALYWKGIEKYQLKTQSVPAAYGVGGGWARVGLEPISTSMKIHTTPYLLNIETGKEL